MNYSFTKLNLDPDLVESLSKLGIHRPSQNQYNFIKSFEKEASIIYQSKSGTGKTVAFCISVLQKIIKRKHLETHPNKKLSTTISGCLSNLDHLLGDVVIIVPTRELAYHIYLFFVSLKRFLPIIKSALLIAHIHIFKFLTYIKNEKVNVVVSTPGRFGVILKCNTHKIDIENYAFKSNQPYFKTHTLIFDEADLLMDEQFYKQTKFICSRIGSPFVQIIGVSATFIKPQLKKFEDMIYELDQYYINRFVKTNRTITQNILGKNPRLTYYICHLLLSKKIKSIYELVQYVSGYERTFKRMILSPNNVKRTVDMKTQSSDEFSQSIVDDSDGCVDLDIMEDKDVYNVNHNVYEHLSVSNNDKLNHVSNDTHNLNYEEHGSPDTSVIDQLSFYYAVVKDAPNIVLQIGYKIEVLVKVLSSVKYKKCIIFSNQSHMRAQTYGILKYLGYTCYIISSRTSHSERLMMLYDLNAVDNVIVLCTDVMSRGIGLSNVDLVIDMDIPGSKEIFLHRSGRSGRFGSKGVCVSICMESEFEMYKYFLFSLKFKSDSVDKLYDSDVCVNENISDYLMKTINFVKLEYELAYTKTIMNKTLSSSMLDTDDYKFNVSIIGFISHTDMRLFNTNKTQPLMYIDVVDKETVITIKMTEDNELLFESFSTNVQLVYSENDINSSNRIDDNNNIIVTHIVVKINNSYVLISLPKVEFIKLINSEIKTIELVKLGEPPGCVQINNNNKRSTDTTQFNELISNLLESKCSLNYDDFKAMLNVKGVIDDNTNDSNVDSEHQLLNSLDRLTLRSHDIVTYFSDYVYGRFHNLVNLYIRCTEAITTFKESSVKEVNLNTIREHFIKTHVSLWNSLNNS